MIGFPVLHHLLQLAQIHVNYVVMHPIIFISVVPFSSCFQSFPATRSFPMSWHFASGGQNIGDSASGSVPPKNIQGLFILGLNDLISLQFKRLSRVFSNITVQKCQFVGAQSSSWSNFMVQLSPLYLTTGKTIALTRWTFVSNTSVFNMLSRLVTAFHQESKHVLISWLQSPSAVILELKKI